jgi:hypothetical protein
MAEDFEEILDFASYLQENTFCKKCIKSRFDLCSCNRSKYGDIDPEPAEIYPGLYLGSILFIEDDEWMYEKDIKCTINMTENDYLGNKIISMKEIDICHLPSIDKKDFPIIREYGEKAFEFVKSNLEKNNKIFIHCLMGYNRSACIACYLVWRLTHRSMKDIIKEVMELRPCIFSNTSFIKQLLKTERDFLKSL